jgi:hypothetical protein
LLLFLRLHLEPPAAQRDNFVVSGSGTANGSIPHEINLKVAQIPGGQLSEVSGFVINPEDVVQVKHHLMRNDNQ